MLHGVLNFIRLSFSAHFSKNFVLARGVLSSKLVTLVRIDLTKVLRIGGCYDE